MKGATGTFSKIKTFRKRTEVILVGQLDARKGEPDFLILFFGL